MWESAPQGSSNPKSFYDKQWPIVLQHHQPNVGAAVCFPRVWLLDIHAWGGTSSGLDCTGIYQFSTCAIYEDVQCIVLGWCKDDSTDSMTGEENGKMNGQIVGSYTSVLLTTRAEQQDSLHPVGMSVRVRSDQIECMIGVWLAGATKWHRET